MSGAQTKSPHKPDKGQHSPADWQALNRDYWRLELQKSADLLAGVTDDPLKIDTQLKVIKKTLPAPAAIDEITSRFGLNGLEREILCLIALADQPPRLAKTLQTHPQTVKGRATLAVIESVLGDEGVEALSAQGKLRRHSLIFMAPDGRRFECPLFIAESCLEFLNGQFSLTPEIQSCLNPLPRAELTLGEDVAIALGQNYLKAQNTPGPVHFHYSGNDRTGLLETLRAALLSIDVPLLHINAAALIDNDINWDEWRQHLSRDFVLSGAALAISLPPNAAPAMLRRAATIMQRAARPVYLLTDKVPAAMVSGLTPLNIAAPSSDIRTAIWRSATPLSAKCSDLELDAVGQHFALTTDQIRRSARQVLTGSHDTLWEAARAEAGQVMGHLAKPVLAKASWDDLVLPPAQRRALNEMSTFLAQRERINNEWGFGEKSSRGLGMAALFYGASGTGKTTAAEVLIKEMSPPGGAPLQLFRIDVASLVSKYIGETAKNLDRVFKAGERAGAALLFDEAEGLFAKRTSNNRDSLDKHSNAELGFLLQCLEDYPGVAILTTNMRQLIDDAFLRRFRFVIEFPFPDRASREAIWRRAIPAQVPTGQLDYENLSRPSLSGGNIRSIAINAAYQAAASNMPLSMMHIAGAMRLEFVKLDKPAPDQELSRWRA